MAFSNIENSEKLDIINIAIVDNEDFRNNKMFEGAFKTLSDENNEDRLFDTKYTTEEEAKKLLEEDEITGYMIIKENKPKIVVSTSGIEETVFKYVTEEIAQTSEIGMVQNQEINIENISNSNLSYTMIEFYTLIAMACLYGGILGMVAINQNLANMTSKRKKSISCTNT